jgi:sterol desaturase/sphingolipid hydroxylase (fatty acid hydroxylase superfamily)
LLTGLLLSETLAPFRPPLTPTAARWVINATLYLITVLIAAVLVPDQWSLGFGVMPWVNGLLGSAVAVAISALVLDLSYYGLHRLQHATGFLWRLHLVHHSDVDVDVTTAIRHHPGETLVSCVMLGAVTVLFGIPAEAIALYGTLSIAAQMLQHANVAWPGWAERLAGLVIMTPALHRRHHAEERRVSDTNFGTVFSFWDRLFGSFDASSPVRGFGVHGVGWQHCRTLWAVLVLPLGALSRDSAEPAE